MGFPTVSHVKWCIIPLLMCAVTLRNGDCQVSLVSFSQDICNNLAQQLSTSCTCVDTVILPGPDAYCGVGEALGNGVTVKSQSFVSWDRNPPVPTSGVLSTTVCDNRNSNTTSLICTETGAQSITSQVTATVTQGTGLMVHLGMVVDGVGGFEEFSVTIQSGTTNTTGNTVTTTSACGPGGTGQPGGTCTIYKDTFEQYDVAGATFTYEATLVGGVQISFSNPVDIQPLVGGVDGTAAFWWVPMSLLVQYAQKNNVPGGGNFKELTTEDFEAGSATFRGSGTLDGFFIDARIDCSTSNCP